MRAGAVLAVLAVEPVALVKVRALLLVVRLAHVEAAAEGLAALRVRVQELLGRRVVRALAALGALALALGLVALPGTVVLAGRAPAAVVTLVVKPLLDGRELVHEGVLLLLHLGELLLGRAVDGLARASEPERRLHHDLTTWSNGETR